MKIMPGVEGDRSDCQPETNSIARSLMLSAMMTDNLIYHPQHRT